jgi:hypothetical protein
MDPTRLSTRPPTTSAEKEALNVFHDLQLAYTREKRGAPKRAARLQISSERNFLTGEKESLSRHRMERMAAKRHQ